MGLQLNQLIWAIMTVAASMAEPRLPGFHKKQCPNDSYLNCENNLRLLPHTTLNTENKGYADGEAYDFIVVGSGAAGAIIANRLSEVRSWRILLLEAGYPENGLAQYPTLANNLQFTDYNWGYTTEPQKNCCLAMTQRRCTWPRGRALGGSTVISSMLFNRGNPEDYDRWAALGNPGWSYEDVLPYFLKSEDARLNYSNPDFHCAGGYQSVQSPVVSEYAGAFVLAGQQLGYKIIDHNSPEPIGFATAQTTTRKSHRQSIASAFLAPVLGRQNLRILTGARVTKVLIDPSTTKAYGVEYILSDRKLAVKATKEVIVSGGAIGSPQLLMLSGIGPKNHLEELGIKSLRDLPVGETLYDHILYLGLVINTNASIASANMFDPAQQIIFQTKGEGPLASVDAEALAYIHTGISPQDIDYPDVEIVLSPMGSLASSNAAIARAGFGIRDDYSNLMFSSLEGSPSIAITPVLLHPKSKGHMKLRSSDPYDYPILFGNYLTDSDNLDARTLVAGIRFIQRLIQTPALQRYNTTLNPKPVVGCEAFPFNSGDYWLCAIRFLSASDGHQMSTCKMGPASVFSSVVNNELKVHRTANLRVADASVIPFPLSSHTIATTMMVGELASDLVKKEWGVLKKPGGISTILG